MRNTLHALLRTAAVLCMAVLLCTACTPRHKQATPTNRYPAIYPDYADIAIPRNIAPLNFLLRGDGITATEVVATCGDETLTAGGKGAEVTFGQKEWKAFLKKAAGKKVTVTVYQRDSDGKWLENKPFFWEVTAEPVDPYLTYRLIEPDYETFNHLTLHERCLENYDERAICDYGIVGNNCMNCHIYGSQNPDLSLFYVRGANGGAILNQEGKLRKLNIRSETTSGGSVYAGFSPDGRYLVFSANTIIPTFHAQLSKRMEVYDSSSDIYVADLKTNTMLSSPLLADTLVFETFPTFSPDGKYIYYCSAPVMSLPEHLKDLQYALCRIAFDARTGTFGTQADTLYTARSVCHPRVSPDGRHLLFSVADYGTFPIWHPEADLYMMDLKTGAVDTLAQVNSNRSDTYHSWASNSRWFVFASKRDDGLYGKPYLCYVDKQGRAHKPFAVPQREPSFYDNNLKSFNTPELGRGRLPFKPTDVAKALGQEAERFSDRPQAPTQAARQ